MIDKEMTTEQLIERRERLLGPAYRLFYEEPFHPTRGDGVWLYDADNTPFLDAYNNVPSVGHCHPHVVEAIARQAAILNTHTRYLDSIILDYAERLLETVPAQLDRVMLTCTGSEANDLALRIAREFTGGTGVIVTEFAYHGVTSLLAELSPSLGIKNINNPNVYLVKAPDPYRNPEVNLEEFLEAEVINAIKRMRKNGIKPAALLVDTIFSSDGVFAEPKGFLRSAVEAIRKEGGVFIADEVQAGLARTGESVWGVLRHDVVPDVLTMGKPMGNGHPLAGILVRAELAEKFNKQSRYFNTFGGNPVSCAAGAAVLDVIERESLLENSFTVGEYLKEALQNLANQYDVIGDIRGAGLFIGLELVSDKEHKTPAVQATRIVVNSLRKNNVLVGTTGPLGNILKIRPPLVFTKENADFLCDRLDSAFSNLKLNIKL